MSYGVSQAAVALGTTIDVVLAVDSDFAAASTYKSWSPRASVVVSDLARLFCGNLGEELTATERRLEKAIGSVDLLVGGPPCQGHSNLNNHTRRADPKNSLYRSMVRAAEVLLPAHVIIENVAAVVHDRKAVVDEAELRLSAVGYSVRRVITNATNYGVPQQRLRHLLLASLDSEPQTPQPRSLRARSVAWGIADLAGADPKPKSTRETTQRRIDFLFDNDLYELPNFLRPTCHRDNPEHSYKSVYGRLHWDRAAPTITTGFACMGQGRYVHPSQRRTLTVQEAARLQSIPDSFPFSDRLTVSAKRRMIGNAVPPQVAYAAALSVLR
jgi:DNA (cytosine-5)-methyltransferase 1